MSDQPSVRLNKVLRELNISLDRAVEFLNQNGIEVDARPTTKITTEVYNTLLDEFRMNRNHMAIVIDEYGEVTGLVTIEDVLEEIVGEIEDETDDQLNKMIERNKDGSYLVSALTPIEDFNLEFNSNLLKEDFDTLGGILSHHFGKIPKKNDSISIESLQFFIESTEKRRIKEVRVIKLS